MPIPKDLIIVVGRRFGSGGRLIGKALAKRFSLQYYDKEMLKEAAATFGYSQQIFANRDEKRPSILRALLTNAFGVGDSYFQNPMSSEEIYKAQSEVIRELAARGGCVFVGRSADYILRDNPNMVSIFLTAPLHKRVDAIMERGDADSRDKAEDMAKKFDKCREDFYNYFTGRKWGHTETYHLSLDASALEDDSTVNVIENFIQEKFK